MKNQNTNQKNPLIGMIVVDRVCRIEEYDEIKNRLTEELGREPLNSEIRAQLENEES